MVPGYIRQLRTVINICNIDPYGCTGSVEDAEQLYQLTAELVNVIEAGEVQLHLLDDEESTRRFIMGLLPELCNR